MNDMVMVNIFYHTRRLDYYCKFMLFSLKNVILKFIGLFAALTAAPFPPF